MSGKELGRRIEVGAKVIDSDGRLAKTNSDQLELTGVGCDISHCIDAGLARAHGRIDNDARALEFKPPMLDWAEAAFEANVHQHGIQGESFFGLGGVIPEGDGFNLALPLDRPKLVRG